MNIKSTHTHIYIYIYNKQSREKNLQAKLNIYPNCKPPLPALLWHPIPEYVYHCETWRIAFKSNPRERMNVHCTYVRQRRCYPRDMRARTPLEKCSRCRRRHARAYQSFKRVVFTRRTRRYSQARLSIHEILLFHVCANPHLLCVCSDLIRTRVRVCVCACVCVRVRVHVRERACACVCA